MANIYVACFLYYFILFFFLSFFSFSFWIKLLNTEFKSIFFVVFFEDILGFFFFENFLYFCSVFLLVTEAKRRRTKYIVYIGKLKAWLVLGQTIHISLHKFVIKSGKLLQGSFSVLILWLIVLFYVLYVFHRSKKIEINRTNNTRTYNNLFLVFFFLFFLLMCGVWEINNFYMTRGNWEENRLLRVIDAIMTNFIRVIHSNYFLKEVI